MAQALVDGPVEQPRLYLACGTEDFLYEENMEFRDFAAEIGLEVTYEEGPGDHTWDLWDATIQRVIEWLPLS